MDIANRPPFSSLPAPLLPAPLNRAAPPAASPANSDFAFASRWHPRVAPEPPHRPPSSRWSLPGRATHPRRFQSRPGGRHRDAVVERPLQHPRASFRARPSLWRTPILYSARSLSDSPLRRPRTPPPLRRTPASSPSPSNPLLRPSPPQINPVSSSYLVPRCSPTLFPLQSFTGASSPLTPTAADRRVTRSRRHEPPRSHLEVLLDPLLLSHPIPSPPVTRSPGNVRSNPASPL